VNTLTEERIELALPKVERGLNQYLWLQNQVHHCNAFVDAEFRKRYGGFYRLRRNLEWRDHYFRIMEETKDTKLQFGEVLRLLHQHTNRVEASFTSKLVATLDPTQPVIDAIVLQNLGLSLPARTTPDRLTQVEQLHNDIKRRFTTLLGSDQGQNLVRLFRHRWPDAHITDIKMLDLVLWQIRP